MPDEGLSLFAMKLRRFFMKRLCPRGIRRHIPRGIASQSFPGVIGRIHALDEMMTRVTPWGLDRYRATGRSAFENCEASLAAAGRSFSDVRTCLDLPCGYGRVLRLLQHRIGPAGVTACELDPGAVDFCRREFGVQGLLSADDPDRLAFPDAYDLIWVGSLFTHLDPGRCAALLRRLGAALRTGGVLVFTTHGESCFARPGLPFYGRMFSAIGERMTAEFKRDGHCYSPYYATGYYGISLHSEEFVRKLVRESVAEPMQPVRFQPRGWDDHQDVWAYRKA
jgi:SAM-dependent methyltransferase